MKKIKIVNVVWFLGLLWACNPSGEDIIEENILPDISIEVTAIAVDKDNTKWIGTNKGLYKNVDDGYKAVSLSVSGKIGALFYEETNNTLWIGTETILLKGIVADGNILEEIIPSENLSDSRVLSIHIDSQSKKWFGTQKGISLNNGETWKNKNFRNNTLSKLFPIPVEEYAVNSIASIDGDYFFATSGAKLYRAFGYNTSLDAFSGATQWDSPYNGQNITDTMFVVFVDKQGKQWMGGTNGIQMHTGHNPKDASGFEYYDLPDNYILSINQAPNGNIWVGTRKGLGIFNGSDWIIITDLPDLYVSSISFDKNGSAWVGTKKGLVNIWR